MRGQRSNRSKILVRNITCISSLLPYFWQELSFYLTFAPSFNLQFLKRNLLCVPRKRYLFILKRFFKNVHIEMVDNYTFKTKSPILIIFWNMPISEGTNRCVDLSSASIYSSYNIISQSFCNMRCNKIPVVIDLFILLGIYLGSQIKFKNNNNNNNNTLYFEKTIGLPISAESFTWYISIPV